MDPAVLNTLTKCRVLSLSTNSIEKMVSLSLRNLEILSLSRNRIKRIAGLEEVGKTLKELWLSYNFIDKLDGLQSCIKLQTLYVSNNRITSWDELDKLKELPELQNVLFIGNPIYDNQTKQDAGLLVLKKLRNMKNIDGVTITDQILEKLKDEPPK
eukprot:TRINITY_DN2375_c0_g2_i2.p1 TRINITY_DN2375_c0_g2~~TRINITY_DN2375_c0_g2_i2.p1  ORF type:complete len:156 (-),score=36.20 TRINITY_DN2375_c0_g2_i2:119-586(-)